MKPTKDEAETEEVEKAPDRYTCKRISYEKIPEMLAHANALQLKWLVLDDYREALFYTFFDNAGRELYLNGEWRNEIKQTGTY